MKARAAAAALMPAAALGLAGCANATSTCTVRHQFAIVIFQDGAGNAGTRYITRFRLNVDYGGGAIEHQVIAAHIALKPASGGNPPLIIKTYGVGSAVSCSIDDVRAHR